MDAFAKPFACCAAAVLLLPAHPAAAPQDSEATDWNNQGVSQARAGHFEEAIASLRRALALSPEDESARKNLSGVLSDYARQREGAASAEEKAQWLSEAVSLDSTNGLAWLLLGDVRYFRQNDLAAAIGDWQKAQGRLPEPLVKPLVERLVRAQRDWAIERGYAASATEHFVIRVQDARRLDLNALGLLLEQAYGRLSRELGAAPEKIAVIVYTQQELRRVGAQRDWTIGLYDGRLRLRADELAAPLLPDLAEHELAHAFLHRLYGPGVPVWAHEGYAQLHESEQVAQWRSKELEEALQSRAAWIPLQWLDRHFQQPSDAGDLQRAYAQSRLVVRLLIDRRGMESFRRFLAALSRGQQEPAAFDAAFAPWRWNKVQQGVFE